MVLECNGWNTHKCWLRELRDAVGGCCGGKICLSTPQPVSLVEGSWQGAYTSGRCNSVWKPHANLPDTPVALTSASQYFQMLPAPPGALQCALGLCKSILRCSWKHLQLWRCIQDATRLTIRIVEFWSCWDHWVGLQENARSTATSAQCCGRRWERLRPLRKLCERLGAKFSQQWFLDSSGS